MAKVIDNEIFEQSILGSDVGDWRSEPPQQGTIQAGRYTYDAMVSENLTKFLVYIVPDIFDKQKNKYRVHLDASWEIGFWTPIYTHVFEVNLSGVLTEFESWPQTDDRLLTKIAKIVTDAGPAFSENQPLN